MSVHQDLISLIIAYTLTGAFVFTVIITCGSLVGWVKFADPKQQKKLFGALIVEVVVICVGSFAGFVNFSASGTQSAIASDAIKASREFTVSAPAGFNVFKSTELGIGFAYPDKLERLNPTGPIQIARFRFKEGPRAEMLVQTNVLPPGKDSDKRTDDEVFKEVLDTVVPLMEELLADFRMTKREPYPAGGMTGELVTFQKGKEGDAVIIEMKFLYLFDAAHRRVHQFNIGAAQEEIARIMPIFQKVVSTVVFPSPDPVGS